jgi:hypothetical protein
LIYETQSLAAGDADWTLVVSTGATEVLDAGGMDAVTTLLAEPEPVADAALPLVLDESA